MIAQVLLLVGVSWILWRLFQSFWITHPLDNIPGPPSASFKTGNLAQFMSPETGWEFYEHLSSDFGKVVKYYGPLGDKHLFVFDPVALQHVIVKDQHIYQETPYFIQSNKMLLGEGLLAALGNEHKKQRKMLAPAFSIAAMRDMCPIFYGVGHQLQRAIETRVKDGPCEVDVATWMARTALELVGQAGLGYSFDPLAEDQHINSYAKSLKEFMPALTDFAVLRTFIPEIVKIGSPRFRRFILDITPWKRLHALRDLVDQMDDTSKSILEGKKNAMKEGDNVSAKQALGEGKDIMSILLKANLNADEEERLPNTEVLGQISHLTLAATDTTSNALARIFHLLVEHPDVQDKLRKELFDAGQAAGGDIPYDDLVSLPYMDAICRETLRLYAPVPFVSRMTVADAILPLSKPIQGVDGKSIHEIHVPKGTTLRVGIMASNRDKDLWGPDARDWKPERWLSPLPSSVTDAKIPGIYASQMTFAGGSRACIGFKFSQLEMKVVVAVLISRFRFSMPANKKIAWKFNITPYPSVEGTEGSANMPLKVALL